jgi:1-acyl-sn-glycerol-3-phosphate acyltransferase
VILPKIDPENREKSLRESTDEVMCRIAAMLPESYRGFYKDFPRVKELLSEWKSIPQLKIPQ